MARSRDPRTGRERIVYLTCAVVALCFFAGTPRAGEAPVPRVALFPLDDAQYRQEHSDGPGTAELLTALLMIELTESPDLELLDRSIVPALFRERTLPLVDRSSSEGQQTLEKLPLSDYSLVGSLFSLQGTRSYTLKLIDNASGEVIAAERFEYPAGALRKSAVVAAAFVTNSLAGATAIGPPEHPPREIGIGHFHDVNGTDAHLAQGRDLSERLVAGFVRDADYRVLARTQVFPLVFEAQLRKLQYPERRQDSLRSDAEAVIYGAYRNRTVDGETSLTVYLYVDLLRYGRELRVIKANRWDEAYEKVSRAIRDIVPPPFPAVAAEARESSRERLLEALALQGARLGPSVLEGRRPVPAGTLLALAGHPVREQVGPALRLLRQALKLDPANHDARLALAMLLEAAGDAMASTRYVNEVLAGTNDDSARSAWRILRERRAGLVNDVTAATFEGAAGAVSAERILQSLASAGYLREVRGGLRLRLDRKLDRIVNRPFAAPVGDLDFDTSVRALEVLRASAFRPGQRIRFDRPKGSQPDSDQRSWDQRYVDSPYNQEALLHAALAGSISDMYVIFDRTQRHLPKIAFHPEAASQSPARRRARLAIAVDGWASARYLDDSFLEASVMLGLDLCQPEVARCSAGRAVLSWVVDHAPAADSDRMMRVDEAKTVEEQDRLVFLAADAVGRVAEARFSTAFRSLLERSHYFPDDHPEGPAASGPGKNGAVPEQRSDAAGEPATRTAPDAVPVVRVPEFSPETDPAVEPNVAALFTQGYFVDSRQRTAIRGFPGRSTPGPLRASDLPATVTREREAEVIMETLFRNDYLSVHGVPVEESYADRFDRLESDFPEFSYNEVRALTRALGEARAIPRAGKVEIRHRSGSSWSSADSLIPADASDGARFGSAVSTAAGRALICNQGGALYSYERQSEAWQLQRRAELPAVCRSVAMSDEWAALGVGTWGDAAEVQEQVLVYRHDGSYWQQKQGLRAKNYQERTEAGEVFRFFGRAAAFADDELFIGNPGGGPKRKGELYRFVLTGARWDQAEILEGAEDGAFFGNSIAVAGEWLAVGDPLFGKADGPDWKLGTVYLYRKDGEDWVLRARLLARNPDRAEQFGEALMIDRQSNVLLIQSRDDVFRYELGD